MEPWETTQYNPEDYKKALAKAKRGKIFGKFLDMSLVLTVILGAIVGVCYLKGLRLHDKGFEFYAKTFPYTLEDLDIHDLVIYDPEADMFSSLTPKSFGFKTQESSAYTPKTRSYSPPRLGRRSRRPAQTTTLRKKCPYAK